MPDAVICALGKRSDAFFYSGNPRDLKEWEGHGLALNPDPATGSSEGLGVPAPEVETLAEGTGGVLIRKGALLVHTPEYCARGVERASR